MKIITGINKKKFIRKSKIIIYRRLYVFSKYNIIRTYKTIYLITDPREEIVYNDIVLIIILKARYNKILKIIK